MTQKEFLYLVMGAGLGVLVTYMYCKSICGSDNTGTVTKEQCCNSSEFTNTCNFLLHIVDPPTGEPNDAALKGYFQNYASSPGVTDAVGFSLDRRAIAFAAKRCIDDNQIQGLRFYPGKNGTQNFILTIDLIRVTGNSFLNEKTGSGAYFPYDLSIKGHGGPYPNWCENTPAARVIY